jgi:glyoxylase-like metal-dependent hydrolase (beta-lactamase superfamily II)
MGNNCNAFLYNGEKTILIDPGHLTNEYQENCLGQLLEDLEKDGFSPEKIDLVILTHGHPDHCEAATAFSEKYQIRIAMHQADEDHMEVMGNFLAQMTGEKPLAPTIDIYLQEGELELGTGEAKDKIVIYHTPGHSPGSVSLYFPSEKCLVTGDAVFAGSIGRTDFPDGNLEQLGESVRMLSHLEDVEWLLPGHMQIVKGEEAILRNYAAIIAMFF